ncbi:ABC transporter substrate-binding protein [Tumebacillus avium]|nr:ABC transporter substrate-binding protein [Tumebacillus avium]
MKQAKRLLIPCLAALLTAVCVLPAPQRQAHAQPMAQVANAAGDTSAFYLATRSNWISLMPGDISLIQLNTQEGLVRQAPDGKILPGLAASWQPSADGKTFTFTLRDNLKYHDGTTITAQDFVYRWSSDKEFMRTFLEIESVTASDNKTLSITFTHPGDYFTRNLATGNFVPIRQAFAEAKGDAFGTTPANTQFSGPYTVTEWSDTLVRLERNPNYWDVPSVKVPRAVIYLDVPQDTAWRMYNEGKLDEIALDDSQAFMAVPDETHPAPRLSTAYFLIQSKTGPLANRHVRRALAYANPWFSWTGAYGHGGFVPEGMAGLNSTFREEHAPSLIPDPYVAKSELATGLRELKLGQLPPIDLYLDSMNLPDFGSFYHEVLGITINPKVVPYQQRLELAEDGVAPMSYHIWAADFDDPANFLELFHSQRGPYAANWSNAEYDRLLDAAYNSSQRAVRMQNLQAAEDLLLQEAPVIPLYQMQQVHLVQPFTVLQRPPSSIGDAFLLRDSSKGPRAAKSILDFADQSSISQYALAAATQLYNQNVIRGSVNANDELNFYPRSNVSREEFVTMVVKSLGLAEDFAPLPFTDVSDDRWSAPFIRAAVAAGVIKGSTNAAGEQVFRPGDKITRAEIATVLVNALQLQKKTAPAFSDVKSNHWAYSFILTARANNLISGTSNETFGPEAAASRQDAAVMIYNGLKIKPTPSTSTTLQ